MIIPIKQALLEGYTLETIVEAVHANHKHLDKRRLKDPNTSYVEGKAIEKNRKELRDDIKASISTRDKFRKSAADAGKNELFDNGRTRTREANYWDNDARGKSQTGGGSALLSEELRPLNFSKTDKIMRNVPRIISSARE